MMCIMTPFNRGARLGALLVFLLCTLPLVAKDAPLQTIDWPSSGTPVVRFTFGKFKSLPGMGSLHGYVMDTTAENLSPRRIPSARFNVYLFDKNKVRVGKDVIAITNVGPGEVVKFETTVSASGQPVSVSIEEIAAVGKGRVHHSELDAAGSHAVSGRNPGGLTPRIISVGPGHHTLTFTKEGFTAGTFPAGHQP